MEIRMDEHVRKLLATSYRPKTTWREMNRNLEFNMDLKIIKSLHWYQIFLNTEAQLANANPKLSKT